MIQFKEATITAGNKVVSLLDITGLSQDDIAQVLVYINNQYNSLRAVYLLDRNAENPYAELRELNLYIPEEFEFVTREFRKGLAE